MDTASKAGRGAAGHATDHSIAQTDIAQTAPEGNNSNSGDKRESLPDGINIKFTPESQGPFLDSQQLDALLHGPQGLSQLQSQDPLMQTQDCSLQQEMLRAERNSTERELTRAQEAAAALRGEQAANPAAAAAVPDPQTGLVAGQAAEGGMVDIKNGVGDYAAAAMAAAAAAAAAAGGAGKEQCWMWSYQGHHRSLQCRQRCCTICNAAVISYIYIN